MYNEFMMILLLSFIAGFLQGSLLDDPKLIGMFSLLWLVLVYGFNRTKIGKESDGMLDLTQLPLSVFKSEYDDMPIDGPSGDKAFNIFLMTILGIAAGILIGLVFTKSSI